jgi:predicted anti-sigma-YlaC factor YlaD
MECETAREAISALLDGEPSGLAQSELDAHLADCAACRSWREQAHTVTRMGRLAAVEPAPRPVDELIEALERSRPGPRFPSLGLARIGLIAVAAAQLAITAPMLLLGHDREAPIHVAHEIGALDVALAVGFLVAAWRPARATGMRTLVGAAAALLVITAILDLLAGRTAVGEEAPHLLSVGGWLLLAYVAALVPPSGEDRPLIAGPLSRWRLHGGIDGDVGEAWTAVQPGAVRRGQGQAETGAMVGVEKRQAA